MLKNLYPYERCQNVFQIDYEKLFDMGYRCIIFDIDNTLVHHGEDSNREVDMLFAQIQNIGLKTVLLSNNDRQRIERFCKNIETLSIPDAAKPRPEGYHKALALCGVRNSEAVFIGDQIFTDIYGANRCRIPSILVDFIRKDLNAKIGKKRILEKVVLKIYSKSKKYTHRIGDIFI